jgi:hypothetical protein
MLTAYMPIALSRSKGGKAAVTIAMPTDIIMPAAKPWRPLNAMSIQMLCEVPQRIEATTKKAKPARKTFLYPTMSPSRPYNKIRQLTVKR